MYYCSNCRVELGGPGFLSCPRCGIRLSGVREVSSPRVESNIAKLERLAREKKEREDEQRKHRIAQALQRAASRAQTLLDESGLFSSCTRCGATLLTLCECSLNLKTTPRTAELMCMHVETVGNFGSQKVRKSLESIPFEFAVEEIGEKDALLQLIKRCIESSQELSRDQWHVDGQVRRIYDSISQQLDRPSKKPWWRLW